jgi:uncharacterized membrane protein YbhN (UPF0104 family)
MDHGLDRAREPEPSDDAAAPDADELVVRAPSRWRQALVYGGLLVLAAVIAFIVWNRRTEIAQAFEQSWDLLLALFVLTIVEQISTATEYWLLYRAANVPIRWRMNLALFYAGGLGNYLPLQAGSVYRFHFMKAVHGVGYSRTVSVFGQNFVITIAAAGTVIITAVLATAAFTARSMSWLMLVVGIAMLGSAIVIAVVPLPHIRWLKGRPARWWSEFHEGWETLRHEPRVAVRVLLLEVVCAVTFATRLMLVFDLLGVHAPFFLCLALAPVASPATALAITPGALGFREAAVAAAAVAMGFRVPTGIFAAGIDRGVLLLVTVVFGVGGYMFTLPHLRKARREAAAHAGTPTTRPSAATPPT